MATTQDYINQLKIDKQNLVSMLNGMGVEANDNETFTSLTPKVGKIVTDPILQDKTVEITENKTTNIVADNGYNGLNNVEVITNIPSKEPVLQDKTITITENGTTNIVADSGYDGLNNVDVTVSVEASGGEVPEKGVIIDAYNSEGYPTEISIVGMENIPANFMYFQNMANTHILGYITKINLSDDVKSIGLYSFYKLSSLVKINFPKDVTDTGYGAFNGCNKLSIKTLPENIKTIGQLCFQKNHALIQLSMPGLETISGTSYTQSAFGSSNSLKAVWIGSSLTTTNQYNFYECAKLIKIFIDKPRAQVEKLSGYSTGFTGLPDKVGIVVCNDDAGFMTQAEFDAIDWSTYTG